ncbi:oxidoreductase [Enemella evansiae]|uniref:acyl-CoA dehydrogenase family protein n=1 Tax=Enemella evansiae TaxID=2016499 RepID=UPI000B97388F|nr:acyl-CoA dehydrogenase family protein [Enemella evansiae]OYN93344.1 oxidoreductase [Enemella evansiae]
MSDATDTISANSMPDQALIERAKALQPQLRANSKEGEAARRLPEVDAKALLEAGLLSIWVPKRLGGLETNVRTGVDVLAEVAYGNGAAGWVTGLINTSNWMAALQSDQAQQDIWGVDPKSVVSTVFDANATAEAVDGGYKFSGKWGFASGSAHSQWVNLGVFIPKPDGTESHALVLVPASELTLQDTWYTTGMRATASNTWVAEDVFVPEHRVIEFGDLMERHYNTPNAADEPLYRAHFMPLATIIMAAPHLGMARAALDLTLETVPKRRVKYTVYEKSADAPFVQTLVAEAASMIDAATMLVHRMARTLDDAAAEDRDQTGVERARARMDCGHAVTLCREAIDKLMSVNGASAFAEFNYMQQIWRDSHTASRHAFAEPVLGMEIYGRELLGRDRVMPI